MRLASRLRQHFGWPLVLLLASLGMATLAAVQAQRASASHRQTASRLLQDYAAIAAWSYSRRAEQALAEAAQHVLSPILHREMHGLGHWPGVDLLARYRATSLEQCQCAPIFRPATYFAWSLGADTLGVDGVPIDAAARRALLDTLAPHIRATRPGTRAGIVVARVHRTPTLVAYGLMPMLRGDTMVYAFTFDSASVEAGFRDIARGSELLPPAVTRGLSNDSLLALCISPPHGTEGGPTFYSSGNFPRWKLQADAPLSAMAGRLNVHASVRPEFAIALVAGGLPRSRTGYLVALVAMAAGLALLAIRQLRREQQLAQMRADFVAGVSHELRTPLAQMRMFLETLRLGRWQTDDQRDWLLGHVDRETARLSHLVENVLAFAAMSRDRGSAARLLPREVVDVGAEAAEAARAFTPLAAARRASLRVEHDDEALAPLDRARFRQVLLNLLDNAVKYGPAGQTVTVRVARTDASVRLTVDDEGPGVPRGERARVWDSYFRGTGEGTRVAGGSGIGLAIVRQIVTAHGGRAWVDDAPGGGARVVVELPACARPVCESPTCESPACHSGEHAAVAAAGADAEPSLAP